MDSLTMGDVVSDLPKTIVDSMDVAECLEIQYLWVDRYRIDQQDREEKFHQIQQMDAVSRYRRLDRKRIRLIAQRRRDSHAPEHFTAILGQPFPSHRNPDPDMSRFVFLIKSFSQVAPTSSRLVCRIPFQPDNMLREILPLRYR
jgi:hypothetical protein